MYNIINIHLPPVQTSVAASSTIYQLARNPDKQQRLFEELKQAFPTRDAQINQHVLEQMPYMRACVKETLRLVQPTHSRVLSLPLSLHSLSLSLRCSMRPVVIANGRNLQSDAVINGYHVPKGVSGCGEISLSAILTFHFSLFMHCRLDTRHLPTSGCIQ